MAEHKQYMVIKLLTPGAKLEVVPYEVIRPGIELMLFGPDTKEACEKFKEAHE